MSSGPVILVGAGRMGGALLRGWLAQGVGPIFVVEPNPSPELYRHSKSSSVTLVKRIIQLSSEKLKTALIGAQACVVAIKPQVLKADARALRFIASKGVTMISIAAGTHSETLLNAWGTKARIIRAMPNTPGAIGEGITGLFAVRGARAVDRRIANSLLSALGETIWVKRENLIDVVTAVSGSGPAYLFLMTEALTRAGQEEGLPYDVAVKLARATVAGSGALLKRDKHAAMTLRKRVTSPGGTTEAALGVLMQDDRLMILMMRAVNAARHRAEELR